MKQYIIVISLVIFLGCSNSREKEPMVLKDSSTRDEVENIMAEQKITEETFEYATITQLKLQEYIDLELLANQHPDIHEIQEQLHTFGTLKKRTLQDSVVKISNLTPITILHRINDSVQKRKFYYTLKGNTLQITDTITTVITTKNVIIDGIPQTATKITFEQ